MEACLVKILSDLCGLSAACLSDDDEHVVVHAGLHQFFLVLEDREAFLLLTEGHVACFEVFSRLGFLRSHFV